MVLHKIPSDSFFLPSVNLFTATFNTPTAGQYDWGIAANVAQEVQGISPGFLYFISIMNFGATINEGDYLENISTIPRVQLLLSKSGKNLYGAGYPIANYLKNNDISAFFWTTVKDDGLAATFTGVLNQSAALAGVATITAHVSLNCFQIQNRKYIDQFFGITGEDSGKPGIIAIPRELDRRI